MAGILCAIWSENAKHFVPAEASCSLSCSGEIKKLPLFTAKGLVALWKGSVWRFPRHGLVRTKYLTPASCQRLAPCWWCSGLSCDFPTVYPPGWNALCPALVSQLEQGDWLTSTALSLMVWAVDFYIIQSPKGVKEAVFFLKVSDFVSLPGSLALAQ